MPEGVKIKIEGLNSPSPSLIKPMFMSEEWILTRIAFCFDYPKTLLSV
jgi:hypothetical protein